MIKGRTKLQPSNCSHSQSTKEGIGQHVVEARSCTIQNVHVDLFPWEHQHLAILRSLESKEWKSFEDS